MRVDEVLKLEAGGKIADAVKAARSLAVENPDRAEIARLAIDMALRGNKEQAAETVVKALRSKHADSLAAGYVTAYVHLRRGRLEAARKAVDKLSARFPTSTFAALLFADICAAQSDYENAIAKLEAVVSRHGGDGPLHHRLAGLYWRSARLEEAAEAAQQARDLGMTQTANARLLGAALCQLERYGEAVPILHEADESEPGHFDTMALLSVARCGAGDSAGATVDVERALDLKPFSVRAPTGLDDGSGLTVLVPEFASAAFFMRADFAQYQEHNFIAYLTAPDLRVVHAPVTAGTAKRLARSGLRPDIIVNNLTVKELVHDETQEHYQTVIDNFDGVPVVNPIDRVLECGREENYRKFESETDFIFPKTRPLSADAKTLDAVVEEIETHFTWPVLLRPTHTNIGEGMDLIDGPDGLRDRMNLIGRKDHFVIQYHECRNEDGVGRQYRASIVDGEFLGDKANTHVDYQSHNDFRQEAVWFEQGYDKPERAYLADPSGALGFDVYERFASLFAKTPLDIYGIDFAINREGRPVVFEANAAMNLYDLKNVRWTPYHKEYHDNFQRTVARYLRGRAA
ncbi:MAG: tetratricopeptide repeat protein [Pseudomonadota bacterium]